MRNFEELLRKCTRNGTYSFVLYFWFLYCSQSHVQCLVLVFLLIATKVIYSDLSYIHILKLKHVINSIKDASYR